MSNTRENDSQQAPIPNTSQPIADMVCEDIQRRAEHGLRKYGVKLQANNGRNALQDAYEEVLDLAHYLKQRLVEEAARVAWEERSRDSDYIIPTALSLQVDK